MTGETPQTPGDDATTGAIYDIIHTLGGEGGQEVEATSAAASTGPADDGGTAPTAKSFGHENEDLERWLIDDWTFNRRSPAQRRVLGCLGCKLASQPGSRGMITSREIAACTGMDNAAVRRILGRLTDGGYLFSRVLRRQRDGSKHTYTNRPPEQFSLTRDGATSNFKGQLEAPQECGLEREGGQLRPNAAGEKKLVEAGVFEKRGSIPRALLGCLACRRQAGEGIYVSGVERCQGTEHSSALAVLGRLVDAGVLHTDIENRTEQGRPRVFYTFTGSRLARSIIKTLDTPPQCGLENGD